MRRTRTRILATTLMIVVAALAALAVRAAAAPAELDTAGREALVAALDDEQRSEALYTAVLTALGEVQPFGHVVEAERRHQAHLLALFERYGVPVPATGRWQGHDFAVPATRLEACAAAVTSERDNAAIYDRLLAVATPPDVRQVFEHLRSASLEHHLPAFERCAAGLGPGAGPGMGPGAGMGHGKGMGHGGGMGRCAGMGGGKGAGMGAGQAAGCCCGGRNAGQGTGCRHGQGGPPAPAAPTTGAETPAPAAGLPD